MKIYKAEKDAGLAEALKGPGKLSFASAISPSVPPCKISDKILRYAGEKAGRETANMRDLDLFPLNSVLVSCGWNLNDAVFTADELWASRHTPEDKPFNFQHDQPDIIGHITACRVMDKEGAEIADDSALDELPDSFDIHTSAVLYRLWSDEKLQERMNDIIKEIGEGKYFVSMECLYPNFDYALLNDKGEQKIIERNKATAFLTKYLREFGGDGTFQGEKLGKVLRNFIFSGKGLVKNPANPPSVIYQFSSADAKFFTNTVDAGYQTLSKPPAELQVEKELADMKTAQAELQSKLEVAEKAKADAISAKEASEARIKELMAEAAKSEEAKAEAAKVFESFKVEADKNVKALAASELSLKKITRVNQAKAKGLEDADAVTVVENSMTSTDEQFTASLEVSAKLVAKASKSTLPEKETAKIDVEVPAEKAAVTPTPGNTETGPSAAQSLAKAIIQSSKTKTGSDK